MISAVEWIFRIIFIYDCERSYSGNGRIRAIEGFVPHGDAKALKQLLGFLPEQLADDLRGLEA